MLSTAYSKYLVGCAVIYADPERYAYAYETFIGIHRDFEKQGIGRKLTNLEFEVCRNIGMKTIMTNCHANNLIKRKLNVKSGYSEVTNKQKITEYVSLNPKWAGKIFFIKDL